MIRRGFGRRELIAMGLSLPFLSRQPEAAVAAAAPAPAPEPKLAWGVDYGARTVPGIARGSGSAIERTYSCWFATYTIRVPSGEMATD